MCWHTFILISLIFVHTTMKWKMHSQSNIKLPTFEVAHFHTVIAWSHNVQECKNITAFGGACQNQAKIAKTRANCWNVYFPIHLSHYCWQGYVDDAVERWWLGSAVFDYLLSWNIKYSYNHLLNMAGLNKLR